MAYFNETAGSISTSFLWKHNQNFSLVTAWHVVSGRHFQSKKVLSKTGLLPNKLAVSVCVALRHSGFHWVTWPVQIPLYFDDGRARYLVHPEKGDDFDIAVLPLGSNFVGEIITAASKVRDAPRECFAVECASEITQEMLLMAADDVFIVGFPEGIQGGEYLPIWKRASIASEPAVDPNKLPVMLVDTLGKEGLSGSPVYRRATSGVYFTEPGKSTVATGPVSNFVGLYSGRFGSEGAEAQLGIVWKRACVEEAIARGQQGRSSFEI